MISMENVVRSFETVDRKPKLVLIITRPTEVDLGDAYVEWGAASHFAALSKISTIRDPIVKPPYAGFKVTKFGSGGDDEDDNPDDPNEPEVEVSQWTETGRETHVIVISNPEDPEQYVIVEVVDAIMFSGPNGELQQFNFRN